MLIINSIVLINSLVWLLVPIRQFRTRFFLFFLILGLLDPGAYILALVFKLNTAVPYLLGTVILLYPALFEIKKQIKLGLVLILFTAGIIVAFYAMNISLIIQIIIHFIIFVSFLKVMVVFYSLNRRLLLFHLMLVLYEFSLILKFFVYYNEVGIGPAYYYVTTVFEIMIGIFFIIFKEANSPKLTV
jgi:hypothetical protein